MANGRDPTKLRQRIALHLRPVFGGRRLASITTADIVAFVVHRQTQGIVATRGPRAGQRIKDVSNAQINRELTTLKRIFNLAIANERIARRPTIRLAEESPAREGFFDDEQIAAVVRHLPPAIQPAIQFAYHTGWRLHDEVLKLEWRHVDFVGGEVRLFAGGSKNRQPRTFPLTATLRRLLEAQRDRRDALKAQGVIAPWLFFRLVAKGRGGVKAPRRITSVTKAWRNACRAAGCPGRIPHDLRRSAVRNLVRAGIPERVAMTMTGHKTPSVFQRYNIVAGSDPTDAARKLDAAAGGR